MKRHTKNKIAAIQMCSTDNVDDILKAAGELIKQAADMGAKLVVLPEMFAVMNNAVKANVKEEFGSGKIQSFLAKAAQQHKVWLVGGTIPIICENKDKFNAAALLYSDDGVCRARYDKIHLFDVTLSANESYQESAMVMPGKEVVVVDTPVGKLGLAVCFDVRFPDQFKRMAEAGAEIIALPSAFTVPTGKKHWELLLRARAIDNFFYLIGAGQGGHHSDDRKTYGHSMIVEPWGSIVAIKNDAEVGVVVAEIDIEKVQQARNTIPLFKYSHCDT